MRRRTIYNTIQGVAETQLSFQRDFIKDYEIQRCLFYTQ